MYGSCVKQQVSLSSCPAKEG